MFKKIKFLTISLSAMAVAAPVVADTALEEIIVTARRVAERLQDVPISMTVFNQEQITNNNVVNPADLSLYTPSLSTNTRFGPEKAAFILRGFGQDFNTAPTVAAYFADVAAPRMFGSLTSSNSVPIGSFMDLESVQVLKGPQGTLFGRNTTGGAVLLAPKKPTDEFEGYIQGSAGNFDMWRVQGVLNVPLSENLKIRLAGDRQKQDGFMKNKSGIGPDSFNDTDYYAVRLGILANLTEKLENYTIGTYSNSSPTGVASRLVACDRSVPSAITSDFSRSFRALTACDQLDRQNARGDGPRDVEQAIPNPFFKLEQWQVINTTTWELSDTLTIKNIVSYTEYEERLSSALNPDNWMIPDPAPTLDFGTGPFAPWHAGTPFQYVWFKSSPGANNSAQSSFTEELQVQGTSLNGKLTWQTGAYFEKNDPLGTASSDTAVFSQCETLDNASCTPLALFGSVSLTRSKQGYQSQGLYAQGSFDFTDKLSATAGVRYTWDKSTGSDSSGRLRLTDGSITCNNVVEIFDGTPGNPLTVDSLDECYFKFPDAKSEKPTWVIDVQYKPVPDLMLYAKYARGYRQGGVNPNAIGFETWAPEELDNYELGAKFSFNGFNGAVNGYFNIAAFYNDLSQQQLAASGRTNIPGFDPPKLIINAGKSEIQGIEIDASMILFDSLRLDIGYTYLDTKMKSVEAPAIPAGAPFSEVIPDSSPGDELTFSPKNSLTLSATYTLPLDEGLGSMSIGGTYAYTDSQFVSKGAHPRFQRLPATALLNMHFNWNQVMGGPYDLSFFVTNITNSDKPVAVPGSYETGGFEANFMGPPRMWGVRARYHFGN